MSALPFERIAVIGGGLLGSSIGHAVKAKAPATILRFADRDSAARDALAEIFPESIIEDEASQAVRDADLVILCVPVRSIGVVCTQIADSLQPGAVVTDVGSVKAGVAQEMLAAFEGRAVHVIPGHPIAGTEKSGPRAGFAALFEGRYVILTPDAGATDPEPVERLTRFWQALGATVETMAPDHHDLVLAITSHLPHLIAYTIVGTADDLETVTKSEVMKYSAGGFRDFTRIAASDPVMWRDVFLTNKDAVLEVLGRFSEDLSALQRAIRWGKGEELEGWFARTRAIRQGIVELGQDTDEVDFGRGRGKSGTPSLKPYAMD